MIKVASECDPMLEGPNLSFLNKATNTVLNSQNITKAEILFVFALDEFLAELKNKYFQKDHFTDVIAFRLNEYKEALIEGEVYISLPRAKENAKIYDQPYEKEVTRLIIHGCLHLVGFKDDTKSEKKIMTKLEDKLLEKTDWQLIFNR
mgnify:FL=1